MGRPSCPSPANDLGPRSLGIAVLLGVLAVPAAHSQLPPEIIDSTHLEGPIDDFTTHTYSVRASGIGTFADRTIVRRFSAPITELRVTIVEGDADDIGFVGSLLVTDVRPRCAGVGGVQAPVDVTSQVTVSGSEAGLTLRAQENCCCVTGWGSATQGDRRDARLHWEVTFGGPEIEITLDPEPPMDRYVVDAAPAMPTIRATAKVVGVTPDPTPDTTFTWNASLAVDERVPSREVLFDDGIVQDTTTQGEAPYLLELVDSSAILGGRLKLKASATVEGEILEGETGDGLRVEGTNPQRLEIQREIENGVGAGTQGLAGGDVSDALQRMACQENRQRQFTAPPNGGIGPVTISFDDGVGIFQITLTNNCPNPFNDCHQVFFDWRANVAEGIANFRSKVGPARRYPGALRGPSSTYAEFIRSTINPMRRAQGLRPLPGIPAPPFSTGGLLGDAPPNQLLEDAVRGVNGFAGTLFGLVLHEFAPDTDFLLQVPNAELPGLNTDSRVWRRVPAAERPNSGDRDYVANVTGHSPECGG